MSHVRNFFDPDYVPYRWQLIPHYGRGGRGRMVLIRIGRLTLPHQLHLLTKLEVAEYRIGTGAPPTIGNHAPLINSDPLGPRLPDCFRPQFAYRQIRAYVDRRTPELSIQRTPCVFNDRASPRAGVQRIPMSPVLSLRDLWRHDLCLLTHWSRDLSIQRPSNRWLGDLWTRTWRVSTNRRRL